ncbi:MAG: polyphosphate kinase 1 [Bacteroidetes bacterium]|nr:polyphosphate kinase 1 [Bacteroidota bacterium]
MIKEYRSYLFEDREISWLKFNERVLQEAESPETPLMERLKFLAIFSSNLDEFFRVRVAQIRKIQRVNGKKAITEYQSSPDDILSEIQRTVVTLQDRFTEIYERDILIQLAKKQIFLINETNLDEEKHNLIKKYFTSTVLAQLFPVVIDDLKNVPHLRDRSIYLAVRMSSSSQKIEPKHALIEIPSSVLSRFYVLPKIDNNTYIIILEDIIRANLKRIFSIFDFDHFESYIIKLTRDAEFIIDSDETDYSISFLEKIQKSLKQRSKGSPTRFVYDERMPKPMLELLAHKLELKHVNLIPGGRYHNFKDFMDFPKVGTTEDYFETMPTQPVLELDIAKSLFDVVSKKDIVLNHPFQSFDYLIRFLRDAAIDPNVSTIRITLYRVAKQSNVVNALINAVKNGKKVIVLMELQARFDEESNIYWTTKLQEAGAQVHFGKQGQKVHCKICLITRKENGVPMKYAHLSTGNYNGVTSRTYSDLALFTKDSRLTLEVEQLCDSLFVNSKSVSYKHLLVAPEFMKKQFLDLIDNEIQNIKRGKPAFIIGKMNSLVDIEIIKKLYDASRAGVEIKLIIRGICCLVPGVKGLSENITVTSIIDRYLEHTRIYIFGNMGDTKIYLSSADWMTRNLQMRIEVAFPIYDENAKKIISDIINIQLSDNTKARLISIENTNKYVSNENQKRIRAQYDTYEYLASKN